MINSKQRAYLRSMANHIDTIVHVGKDGISENLVKQLDEALIARELVKCRTLENCALSTREACDALCSETGSEPVQVIGSRFTVYRENKKDKVIMLPSSK